MQYNIHLPYYNETFLYGYGFGIPQSNLESGMNMMSYM